jgi:hypothetical protein
MRISHCVVGLTLSLTFACGDSKGDDEGSNSSPSGSTSADGTEGAGDPSYANDVLPIWMDNNCLCHFMPANGDDMAAPVLTLNEGTGFGELVGVDSEQLPTMKRVAPGDLENSYLIHKIRGTHVEAGGPIDSDRMPPLAPLEDEEIATIEGWIMAGAPE